MLALFLSACGSTEGEAAPPADCSEPTITGTAGDDTLTGTEGADVIQGGQGNDTIRGLGGDDVLCGGPGADVLVGGDGDDRLFGQEDERVAADTDDYEWYGDRLSGGPGDDHLDGGLDDAGEESRVAADSVDYRDSRTGVELDLGAGTATGEGEDTIADGIQTVVGSPQADVLIGSDGDDTLSGWGGEDRVEGRGGDDTLESNEGLRETRGRHDSSGATLDGGPGNDSLLGSHGPDELLGGPGDDHLQGGLGADRISGDEGDDRISDTLVPTGVQGIDGGAGRDELAEFFLLRPDGKDAATTGQGTVDLAAGEISTTIVGSPVTVPLLGVEDAWATYGRWTLIGTDGPNVLGALFNDTRVVIRAGGGDDELIGGYERDVLDGGPGYDVVLGSPGKDRMIDTEKLKD